jgi:hypothetical protein
VIGVPPFGVTSLRSRARPQYALLTLSIEPYRWAA